VSIDGLTRLRAVFGKARLDAASFREKGFTKNQKIISKKNKTEDKYFFVEECSETIRAMSFRAS
jgi:hypothetical protein